MGLFDKLFSKKENQTADAEQIVALANAILVPTNEVNDEMFAQEVMGQTLAFALKDGVVVAPASGTVEVLMHTGHAFAIRTRAGVGLLVHIGINTVELEGKGFKLFAKQGDVVKAGQKIVEVDIDAIKNAGYDVTTMFIVTEPLVQGEKVEFVSGTEFQRGQVISL